MISDTKLYFLVSAFCVCGYHKHEASGAFSQNIIDLTFGYSKAPVYITRKAKALVVPMQNIFGRIKRFEVQFWHNKYVFQEKIIYEVGSPEWIDTMDQLPTRMDIEFLSYH